MVDIDQILNEGKDSLMSMVPGSRNGHAYADVFKKNYGWYTILINLSEKISDSKKRARKRGLRFNLDLPYLAEMWINQRGRCALVGVIMDYQSGSRHDKNPYRFGLDRIDNELGYVKGNVRITCHWGNNARNTWADDTFKDLIIKTYNFIKESADVNN